MVEEFVYDCLNFNWDFIYGYVYFFKRVGGLFQGVIFDQVCNILLEDVNYFGICMVVVGDVDGMVFGVVYIIVNIVCFVF